MSGTMAVAAQTPALAVGAAGGTGVADGSGIAATQRHTRLVNAAQQFEGMLLEQMLKPMQKSQETGFGQDPDSERDGSLDTLSSYGTEAVANSIAKSGGLGIARKLVADVDRIDAKTQRSQGMQGTDKADKTEKGSPSTKV